MDLSYKDRRAEDYRRQFADYEINTNPQEIGTTRSSSFGERRDLNTEDLFRLLAQMDRRLKEQEQRIITLEGELDDIAKRGVEPFRTSFNAIKTAHPVPTS